MFVCCGFRRVKGHHTLFNYSPLLKNTCASQVVLDKWFPLKWFVVFNIASSLPDARSAFNRRLAGNQSWSNGSREIETIADTGNANTALRDHISTTILWGETSGRGFLHLEASSVVKFLKPIRASGVKAKWVMVRSGTVQYGTVRYGMVLYGTVRYGTVRYGTVRHGLVYKTDVMFVCTMYLY